MLFFKSWVKAGRQAADLLYNTSVVLVHVTDKRTRAESQT